MAIPLPPGGAVWPGSRWSAFLPGVAGQRGSRPQRREAAGCPAGQTLRLGGKAPRPYLCSRGPPGPGARYFGSGTASASSRPLLTGDPERGWGAAPLAVVGGGAVSGCPCRRALGQRLYCSGQADAGEVWTRLSEGEGDGGISAHCVHRRLYPVLHPHPAQSVNGRGSGPAWGGGLVLSPELKANLFPLCSLLSSPCPSVQVNNF